MAPSTMCVRRVAAITHTQKKTTDSSHLSSQSSPDETKPQHNRQLIKIVLINLSLILQSKLWAEIIFCISMKAFVTSCSTQDAHTLQGFVMFVFSILDNGGGGIKGNLKTYQNLSPHLNNCKRWENYTDQWTMWWTLRVCHVGEFYYYHSCSQDVEVLLLTSCRGSLEAKCTPTV